MPETTTSTEVSKVFPTVIQTNPAFGSAQLCRLIKLGASCCFTKETECSQAPLDFFLTTFWRWLILCAIRNRLKAKRRLWPKDK